MRSKRPGFWSLFRPLLLFATLGGIPLLVFSAAANPDTLLATMQKELQRASASLAKSNPEPYFLSYSVSDFDDASVAAANGSLVVSTHEQKRQAAREPHAEDRQHPAIAINVNRLPPGRH